MNKTKITMNDWLIGKVVAYLCSREGYRTEDLSCTKQGMKAIVKDVFGFRYEIYVNMVGHDVVEVGTTEDDSLNSEASPINYKKSVAWF